MKPKETVSGMKDYSPQQEGRKGKLRLDLNENTMGCSPKVVEALSRITAEDLSVYPEYGEFKMKLARYLGISAQELALSNGSDEAIKAVMETYIEKGNEIILPVPTFSMFGVYASMASANVVEIPYNEDLSFPTKEVLGRISGNTKMVVLVNPNNPTGTAIKDEDILRIVKKAKDSIVLIDEAYFEYYGKSSKELVRKYDNVVVLQTFSKAFGLAGLRLGCVISNSKVIGSLRKVIPPYSVNSMAVIAADAALEDREFVEKYVKEVKESKKYLRAELERLGVGTYPSEANFILADFGSRCGKVCKELERIGILVRNWSNYPQLKGCARIGAGTKEQATRLMVELRKILREKAILFDMDGVLVDVSRSYRVAIKQTAEFFIGQEVRPEEIQEFKERGGFANDWELTEAIISSRGFNAPLAEVIKRFQSIYLGSRSKERWVLPCEILAELYRNYRLGIVTGRPREEVYYALEKNGVKEFFDIIIAMEDCLRNEKPDPYGIRLALQQMGIGDAVYVGDAVDDMIAAKAAGIKAIGVLPPKIKSATLERRLREEGADAVIDNIKKITEVLK